MFRLATTERKAKPRRKPKARAVPRRELGSNPHKVYSGEISESAPPPNFDQILFYALAAVGMDQSLESRPMRGRHNLQLLLSGTVDGQPMTPYAITIRLDGSAAKYGFAEIGPAPIG